MFCLPLACGSHWSLGSLSQKFKLSTQVAMGLHLIRASWNREQKFNTLSIQAQDGPFPIKVYKLKGMHLMCALYKNWEIMNFESK